MRRGVLRQWLAQITQWHVWADSEAKRGWQRYRESGGREASSAGLAPGTLMLALSHLCPGLKQHAAIAAATGHPSAQSFSIHVTPGLCGDDEHLNLFVGPDA